MDAKDRKIIRAIGDSELTTRKVAKLIGLSEPATKERMMKLWKSGKVICVLGSRRNFERGNVEIKSAYKYTWKMNN